MEPVAMTVETPEVGTNAFLGKGEGPTEKELATALGTPKAGWAQLLIELAGEDTCCDKDSH